MQVACMFLLGFVVAFSMICGGSALFGYGIDGGAVFLGSFLVGCVTSGICANN